MRVVITMTIDTDSDAFQQEGPDQALGYAIEDAETALRNYRICHAREVPIRDVNGNTVGTLAIKTEK